MTITLAGFNVDAETLAALAEGRVAAGPLTPETLSAAYARISRDPRPVGELRAEARAEVEKSRKSNERIVFGMGHHSVAEHAVFNFDVVGVSRLALEALEARRLASYTEKSQRYVRLDGEIVVPSEVQVLGLADQFRAYGARCFRRYQDLCERLVAAGVPDKAAGEDARYALPLAVPGQVGLTLNARTLEHLILRLAAHPLVEVRELGGHLLECARPIAPSLLRYVEPGPYHLRCRDDVAEVARSLWPTPPFPGPVARGAAEAVRLVHATPDGDAMVLAALVQPALGTDLAGAIDRVRGLDLGARERLFGAVTAHLGVHDALPREFEHATLTFDVTLSAAAFGQLKRHRLASLTSLAYDPALGITVPPAIEGTGLSGILEEGAREGEAFASAIGGAAGEYALINAHRRRVALTLNLRELYHVSRLREDAHAQWDIRALSAVLSALARTAFPVCGSLLGGKDRWPRP